MSWTSRKWSIAVIMLSSLLEEVKSESVKSGVGRFQIRVSLCQHEEQTLFAIFQSPKLSNHLKDLNFMYSLLWATTTVNKVPELPPEVNKVCGFKNSF